MPSRISSCVSLYCFLADLSYLTEFASFRPERKLFIDYWWKAKDHESRIHAFESMIKLTKQKIKRFNNKKK